MTAYSKGAHFERRVKKYLEEKGKCVIRQAKSAFPDLWIVSPKEAIPIECKVNGYLSKEDRKKARELFFKHGFRYLYVFYREKRKIKSKVWDAHRGCFV